ncbi:MAG: DUF2118 domain-containing protein [Alphaproteobacteria bacterium]
MLKKFRISVDGKPYNVVVEDVSDGQAAPAAAPVAAAAPAPAAAAPAPVAAAPAPAAPSAPVPAGAGAQLSPLNGVLVSVDVAMGQDVKEGDAIATIEAMKMKSTVYAEVSGKVTAIHAKPGDPLDQGQAILTLG